MTTTCHRCDGPCQAITEPQLGILMSQLAGLRPRQDTGPHVLEMWWRMLHTIHHIAYADAEHAVLQLAEADNGYDIPPGAVVAAARRRRNSRIDRQKAQARQTELATPLRALPSGRAAWDDLSEAEQDQWITKARAEWPDWLQPRDNSPLLVGHAAALSRGVNTRVPPAPADSRPRCGCSAVILGVDPPGGQCRHCAPKATTRE